MLKFPYPTMIKIPKILYPDPHPEDFQKIISHTRTVMRVL